jgi:hypothetical protein
VPNSMLSYEHELRLAELLEPLLLGVPKDIQAIINRYVLLTIQDVKKILINVIPNLTEGDGDRFIFDVSNDPFYQKIQVASFGLMSKWARRFVHPDENLDAYLKQIRFDATSNLILSFIPPKGIVRQYGPKRGETRLQNPQNGFAFEVVFADDWSITVNILELHSLVEEYLLGRHDSSTL